MTHTDPSCHPLCGGHIMKSDMVYSNILYVASKPAKLKKICGPSPKESRDRIFSNFFCTWLSIQNTSKKSVWQNFSKIFDLTGIILFIKFDWPFSKYILAIDVIEAPYNMQSVIFESSYSQPFLGSGPFLTCSRLQNEREKSSPTQEWWPSWQHVTKFVTN